MNVKLLIYNTYFKVSGIKDIEIVDNLDKITSFHIEGYQYTRAYTQGIYDRKLGAIRYWDGKKHLLSKKMTLPIGLLYRVKKFLKLYDLNYDTVDLRSELKKQNELKIKNFVPREYQLEALRRIEKYGSGMLRIATGGGKTLLAAMITAKLNLPTNIYVIGKDLLYQFHEQMEKALGIEIGIIGDGICNIKKINVVSIWTAITSFGLKQKVSLDDEDWSPEVKKISSEEKTKIKNLISSVNISIFDEAHFLACQTLQQIFKVSKKCRYFIGLTGTDFRDDGQDLLLEAVCGPKIYNLTASELIKKDYLVPPKITFLNVPAIKDLSNNYHTIYSKYITNNDTRNQIIVDSAHQLLKMGKSILILVRYISHGKILSKMLKDVPLFFVNGEIDGEKRKEVKKSFTDGNLKCLIASSVFDIGIDLPKLDALILAGGGKSSVRALQRIGRVIRKYENKKDAIVVDFIDNAKFLYKHSGIRLSVYETENLFKIKFPKGFDDTKIKRSRRIKEKIK